MHSDAPGAGAPGFPVISWESISPGLQDVSPDSQDLSLLLVPVAQGLSS